MSRPMADWAVDAADRLIDTLDADWSDAVTGIAAALRKARREGLEAALAEVEPFIERTNADIAHAIAKRIQSLLDQEPA